MWAAYIGRGQFSSYSISSSSRSPPPSPWRTNGVVDWRPALSVGRAAAVTGCRTEGGKVMTRKRVGAKGLAVLQEDLSVRDLAIIRQVADLRLMTGRQIADLHFAQNEHETAAAATRASNRVLARLVRDGLLARLERRVGGVRNGSSRFVYALGALGHRVLALDGPRPRFREPGTTFALHTLAVTQLVVDCTLAARDKRFDVLNCQSEPALLATVHRHERRCRAPSRPVPSARSQRVRAPLFRRSRSGHGALANA